MFLFLPFVIKKCNIKYSSFTDSPNVTLRSIHPWRSSSSPFKSMRSPSFWLPCKYKEDNCNFLRFVSLSDKCKWYFLCLVAISEIFMSIDLISTHKGAIRLVKSQIMSYRILMVSNHVRFVKMTSSSCCTPRFLFKYREVIHLCQHR